MATSFRAFEGRNLSGVFACPDCQIALESSPNILICPSCHRSWPLVDGIPHFVTDFPYWGEIPREQMQEINRRAAEENWKKVLVESPDATVRRAAAMILDLDRANWHFLAGLPADCDVLDLGAGTGTTSHALARHYRQITALEPVLERVQFMRHRFAQENIGNVRIVRSSLWTLPFLPESFDLVAMNGVLEWVPVGREGDPETVQIEALKNAFRLLRPGGYLYVGIENRFASGYFAGYNDPHAELPWVTILPRRMANWYARQRGRDGYRNYLYSSRGYHRLLRKAGFTRLKTYLAIPSYNDPRFLIPLEGDEYSNYARKLSSARQRLPLRLLRSLFLRAGMLKHFEYAFAILAGK